MGAWGEKAFQNDSALDWLSSFESDGLPALHDILATVADTPGDDYLDVDDGCPAIAAAEIVAAALGRGRDRIPKRVRRGSRVQRRRRLDERDHPLSLAKKAVALFHISRSTSSRFTRLRSSKSSARSSLVTAPGGGPASHRRPRPAYGEAPGRHRGSSHRALSSGWPKDQDRSIVSVPPEDGGGAPTNRAPDRRRGSCHAVAPPVEPRR